MVDKETKSNNNEVLLTDSYPSDINWKLFYKKQNELFRASVIPDEEILDNLTLYASLSAMRRFLFWDRMYQYILDLCGVGMLFGVRWGRDLAALQNLRTIYEPMNYTRKFIGFDTFEGFPSVSEVDGNADIVRDGGYSVPHQYEQALMRLLSERKAMLPYGHLNTVEIVKGDATKSLGAYLDAHPETAIAFAYFDFDLYEPTRICAERIKPHLIKGAVVGFDEYMHPNFPGETQAIREVFGNNAKIQRIPNVSPGHPGFLIFDG